MFHILRGRKITDGLHVPLERPHAVLVHPVAQELHGGGGKHALCRVDLQAVLLKDGEDLPEMLMVLLQGVAEPLTKSMQEKNLQPCSLLERSRMLGRG